MKTRLLLTAASCFLFYCFASAQTQLNSTQWEDAKKNGTLDGKAKAAPSAVIPDSNTPFRISPNVPVQPAASSCQCWQTRDSSWSIVPMSGGFPPEYRNDDFSSPLIPIPFSFCLYGTTWTDCYINNNGNISFGAPYGTFTATGFPNPTFTMVAPFWSDVDTRGFGPPISGLPYYKITPTYMIVQWDSVGYYSSYTDKLNTFQVIITNGSDPIVPAGNVSFCYKDMQWTTGDASGGINGFNGSDAVVGANKGDGINYIQFGAFNQPGGNYNGPSGANSGIDWLDNQSFAFDACTNGNNVPPTAAGITVCDTLHLCVGDSLPLNVTFFSPEVAQTTVITVDTTGTTGYVITSNTSGNTATINSYFVGSAGNIGFNTITIIATDNGTPVGVTNIPIVIEVSTPPVTTISADTSVCNGPVTLQATGGGTYTWLPASGLSCTNCPGPVANPTITTTYTVAIDNGCTVNRTVTVYAFPLLISNDTSICSGSSAQLVAVGGMSYAWLPVTGLSNPAISNPVATPTVTTTYTVNILNALFPSCNRVDSVTITVTPTPTAVASNDTTICAGASANLLASGGTNYNWTPAFSLNNSTVANPIATPATTTTYVVTVSNGTCSDTEPIVITVSPAPTISAGLDVAICDGGTVQLNANGTGTFSWSPTTGLSNPNISNPVASPTVTTTYTVTLTNSSGCSATDVMTVTVNAIPVATASNDTAICAGNSVNLTSSGGTFYSWSPSTFLSNANISNPVATPTITTTYVVTVSNAGCSDAETVVITVQSALATAGPDVTICEGEGTVLSATGGTTYSWSPATGLSDPNIANPIASPNVTTTYTLTASNSIGCTDVDVITVTVSPSPTASFIYSPTVIFQDSTYYFTDQSTGSVTAWSWDFGDGNTSTAQNPSHYYALAGVYHVCLVTVNSIGCDDTTCWDVLVLPRDIEAPNVFTPNADGTNDVLVFKNLEHYPNSMIQIYDRWGVLIYENGNYLNDWNGKKNGTGTDCVDGTYYYVLSGPLLKETLTGFVQLIRGK